MPYAFGPRQRDNAAMQEIRTYTTSATRAGISLGSALAVTISWSLHKSILWAIIHGVLSWFYVIYYVLTR